MTRFTEDQIKHMVDRFLNWSLPKNFNPDAGIVYRRPDYPASWPGPMGTNLFDATQADAMVRHMIDEIPADVDKREGGMKEYSQTAWEIASLYSDVLASETRDLAAHIDLALAAERRRSTKLTEHTND